MDDQPKAEVSPPQRSSRGLLGLGAICLVLILLGAGALFTRAQHKMIQTIQAMGGWADTEPLGPQWLAGVAGGLYGPFLYRISSVDLSEADLSDRGLAILARLPHLKGLELSGQAIHDADLAQVAECGELRYLALDATPISDLGLQYLNTLKRLEILSLRGTQIYDESLSRPRWWPRLRLLRVEGTHITPQAVDRLREARPGLVVTQGSWPQADP